MALVKAERGLVRVAIRVACGKESSRRCANSRAWAQGIRTWVGSTMNEEKKPLEAKKKKKTHSWSRKPG